VEGEGLQSDKRKNSLEQLYQTVHGRKYHDFAPNLIT
jgi:hypothetical protein